MGLLITDSAAAPIRVTYDVDLVARASALQPVMEWKRILSGWVSVVREHRALRQMLTQQEIELSADAFRACAFMTGS